MSSKARMRPSWRKNRQRSKLPTPPGCKFMTIAQRRASERSAVGETVTAVKRVAKRATKAVTATASAAGSAVKKAAKRGRNQTAEA
ncbi:hypothetical protein [Methylobacterium oxalidis]|uniref:Uncharacterized protein n=1 Tax=Methylobacterium oxalidis TaxID=944322 RepID=A0A512JAG7_9HYPH|nr:hypothetical protein [Methylobacterium oxalidis]GEP06941.1 hypothetical protein MOX02_49790 [Methylobacterium oxalidis]GJE34164.1 hypothetical protein LDDCCGHA_4371 [Methylobacterium oxalidis]GLS64549.1 hypothetical protein GCM10007888_29300 [Methylobacterium oxalidis]